MWQRKPDGRPGWSHSIDCSCLGCHGPLFNADVEDLIEKKRKKKKAVTLSTPKCVYNPGLKIEPAAEWHSCHMFPCVTSIETLPANRHRWTLKSLSFIQKSMKWWQRERELLCCWERTRWVDEGQLFLKGAKPQFQKNRNWGEKIPASGHLSSESTEFSSGSSNVVVWISSSSLAKKLWNSLLMGLVLMFAQLPFPQRRVKVFRKGKMLTVGRRVTGGRLRRWLRDDWKLDKHHKH